ncbi:hypothetical protein LJR219_004783 [Phenylobacterium sp. LjRoot219]|uniref:hypothetical protein n=1 Tax=Phenylobacterium sp. LjRoot219 TaxID=3342283 RepID=UPI003ED0CE14
MRETADTIDEARTWLEKPMDADDFRRLLMAIKAALEEHDGPLCSGDLASLVAAEREHTADAGVREDGRERARSHRLDCESSAGKI